MVDPPRFDAATASDDPSRALSPAEPPNSPTGSRASFRWNPAWWTSTTGVRTPTSLSSRRSPMLKPYEGWTRRGDKRVDEYGGVLRKP
jgi:hypothetical protein